MARPHTAKSQAPDKPLETPPEKPPEKPSGKRLKAPLTPGSTIGILGGGQLGRMLVMAAARLGFRCHVYSDAPGPAFDVAARSITGRYDDWDALAAFAQGVRAVTYEFENVPEATALHLAQHAAVRPGSKALAIAQDRLAEKTFVAGLGIRVAPFATVENAADAIAALESFEAPAILKTRRLGYDGKGQIALAPGEDASEAFAALKGAPSVLELRLAFAREISVLVCRAVDGSAVFYDIPHNTHQGGILRRSVVPAPIDAATAARARDIAGTIATALDYIGVLAVELFDLGEAAGEDRLVVNEIAPRVHNSGHWTIDACAVSQFENHIRAVAGWPLGSAERHSDAEMRNLIGAEASAWRGLAAEADTCLHIYGKNDAREGRKMGHVTRLLPRGLAARVLPPPPKPSGKSRRP